MFYLRNDLPVTGLDFFLGKMFGKTFGLPLQVIELVEITKVQHRLLPAPVFAFACNTNYMRIIFRSRGEIATDSIVV